MRASEFTGELGNYLNEYKYQSKLTLKLDKLDDGVFTQETINEIVLWKLDRYVFLSDSSLHELEKLRGLKTGEHRLGESVLQSLLNVHGIDLPMASTILRFRNPSAFQIIDRHAYRAIYDKDYPLYTASSIERKIDVYFDYLDRLVDVCLRRSLAFETIDRLLYIFDKVNNGKLNKRKGADKT